MNNNGYNVWLYESPDHQLEGNTTLFQCEAEDKMHAQELAYERYPDAIIEYVDGR